MKSILLAFQYTKGKRRAKIVVTIVACILATAILTVEAIFVLKRLEVATQNLVMLSRWSEMGVRVADEAACFKFLTKQFFKSTLLTACVIGELIWMLTHFKVWLEAGLDKEPIFDQNLCSPHLDHGSNIAEFAHRIRHELVEYVGFFDEAGVKIYEQTSLSPTRVQLLDAALIFIVKNGGVVSIHNHPNSKNPFSPNDIDAMLRLHCKLAIVTGKERVYVMEVPETAWKMHEEKPEEISNIGKQTKKARKFNRTVADRFGMTFTEMSYRQFRKACREDTLLSRK